MIQYIDEINRIIIALHDFSYNEEKFIDENFIINRCKEIVLLGRLPDHKETINFCEECKIVEKTVQGIKLTDIGKELVNLNPLIYYEFNDNQKDFLIRKCLLKNKLALSIRNVVSKFEPIYTKNTYRLSIDYKLNKEELQIFSILRQLDLILVADLGYEINPKYVKDIANLLSNNLLTENELLDLLEEQRAIGEIAETIVLEYEKIRLLGNENKAEAACVRVISKLNVSAGYDIESFDGKNEKLEFDRFIEVKGTTRNDIKIFISKNELETAGRLRNNYWVYVVKGIDKNTRQSEGIELFQDPLESLLKNPRFTIEKQTLFIHEKE